jgi:hypothetical protein
VEKHPETRGYRTKKHFFRRCEHSMSSSGRTNAPIIDTSYHPGKQCTEHPDI